MTRDGGSVTLEEALAVVREAGYVVFKDEGLYCPECGAPSPDGYTTETLNS